MRRWIWVAAFALVACATANTETPRPLGPQEMRAAVAGRVLCGTPTGADGCVGVVSLEVSGDTFRFSDHAAFGVDEFSDEALVAFVRELPAYTRYEGVFRELAALIARDGYAYIKLIDIGDMQYDAARRAWCAPAPQRPFSGMSVYLSHNNHASTRGDLAVPPELVAQLGGFFVAFLEEPAVQELFAEDEEMGVGLEVLLGRTPVCVTYMGLITGENVELVSRRFSLGSGQVIKMWDEFVVARPATEILRLLAAPD